MTYQLRMGMRRRAVIRYGWDIIAWDRGFPWRSSPRPHRKPSDMAVSRELLEVLAAALRYGMKTKELSQDWDKLVDFYTQGMCEEWKQVLHRCK